MLFFIDPKSLKGLKILMTCEPEYRPLYGFMRLLWDQYLGLAHRLEAYGVDNIPTQGAILLVGNHVSFYDPPLAGVPLPREFNYFARQSLFDNFIAGPIFKALNAIPVERDSADLKALKKVFNVLKENQGLVLFPEGTRSHDGQLGRMKSGAGMIACRVQLPVIPFHIFGAFEAWNRWRKIPDFHRPIQVVYGKPMFPQQYDPGKNTKGRYDIVVRRIMDEVAAIQCPIESIV